MTMLRTRISSGIVSAVWRAPRLADARSVPLSLRAGAFAFGIVIGLVLFPGLSPKGVFAQAPGRESFAIEPKTPEELWGSIDYLVRAGHPDQAVPYLKRFLRTKPTDELLLSIRDRYGSGSILRLDEYDETKPYAIPLFNLLVEASRRNALRPDRIERFVEELSKSKPEQDYAIEKLRESGSYAVPAIVRALKRPGLSSERRAAIAYNMGRLDRGAVPALLATLDAPDETIVADAADALGFIGDPRAIPDLTYLAADPSTTDVVRSTVERSLKRLTGRSFSNQVKAPVRVLDDEARKYLRHVYSFPGNRVVVWTWRKGEGPSPSVVDGKEAEAILGLKAARRALALEPSDLDAQATFAALTLRQAVDRVGLLAFEANPAASDPIALATVLESGPRVLETVLRRALADRQADLAAATALVLSRVTDRNSLTTAERPSPLLEALSSPDRRVQFAAARALVEMQPSRPFPGSSRVVPTLAWFIGDPSAPKAVVIDGNLDRGNRLSAGLRGLGIESLLTARGDDGFRLASSTADVEAVFIEPTAIQGAWNLLDILTNLRADARTAGLPIFILRPDPADVDPVLREGPLRPQREIEPNDDLVHASPIVFSPVAEGRARLIGQLTDADRRGDYFRLGPLKPGTVFSGILALPESSSIRLDQTDFWLEREVRHGSKPRLTGMLIKAADPTGRIDYVVPGTPEPEPPKNKTRAIKSPFAEVTDDDDPRANEGPAIYGDYFLRVKGKNVNRERGSDPTYTISLFVMDPANPPPPRPAAIQQRLEILAERFPRVQMIAGSNDPNLMKLQIDRAFSRMGRRSLSEAERTTYARQAAGLLAYLAGRPGTPFDADLPRASANLSIALNSPAVGMAASLALGDVPGPEAQRSLADVALDPGKPIELRLSAAGQATRSIQRFGPLLSDDQERRLVEELDRETDPNVRTALSALMGALRPSADMVGRRLRRFRLVPNAEPNSAEPPKPLSAAPNPDK